VKLDEWTDEHVDLLADSGGNAAVNMRYEAFVPENYTKPRQDCSSEERSDFIRSILAYQLLFILLMSYYATPLHYRFLYLYIYTHLPGIHDLSPSHPHTCRRKYEVQQFLSNPQLSCPPRRNDKHSHQQQHSGSSRHGLGHSFKNSWRRKAEHEQKAVKKTVRSNCSHYSWLTLAYFRC
jgi:stromal membrane-associated protein